MKKLMLLFFMGMFLISFASAAFEFDNVRSEKETTFDGKKVSGNELLEMYKPIKTKQFIIINPCPPK